MNQTKSSKSSGGLTTVRNTLLFAEVCVVSFFINAFAFDNSTIVVYSKQQAYIGPRCVVNSGSVQ